jgi:hypothetical protein
MLSKPDKAQLDEYLQKEKTNQIKAGAQFTGGSIAFYWLFLSRMAVFQRFFNDR